MQRNYFSSILNRNDFSLEPNLNSNFDYTRNHTQKIKLKGTKKSPSDRKELVKRVDEKMWMAIWSGTCHGEKSRMFVRENIAQLVGQALGVAYPGIDVGVRMSVYPIVYAAIGDIVLPTLR